MAINGVGSLWGSAWQISASGLRDASLRMDVTANNVANSNTDGFIPDRVDSAALSSSGVDSTVQSTKSLLSPVTSESSLPSQTDLPTEGLNLLLAKHAFQASAKAFKVQSETSKTLIDMLG